MTTDAVAELEEGLPTWQRCGMFWPLIPVFILTNVAAALLDAGSSAAGEATLTVATTLWVIMTYCWWRYAHATIIFFGFACFVFAHLTWINH